jgi:hypothetical protein
VISSTHPVFLVFLGFFFSVDLCLPPSASPLHGSLALPSHLCAKKPHLAMLSSIRRSKASPSSIIDSHRTRTASAPRNRLDSPSHMIVRSPCITTYRIHYLSQLNDTSSKISATNNVSNNNSNSNSNNDYRQAKHYPGLEVQARFSNKTSRSSLLFHSASVSVSVSS